MGRDVVAGLHFRILGPLEVWRDGELLSVGGERQRALLALMLVHANELLSGERLVEALFGEQRTKTTVNALRVAISRLRRALGDGAGERVLLTRPGGYVLQVESRQLDAAQFEALVEHARGLLTTGDPAAAGAVLREALALWRGAPLADLALLEPVQAEMRRLEEIRLGAVIDRIDADLAAGRAAELIGELEALIEANPLQERLRRQLMLALYRAGRQADALNLYRETSALFRAELGLDPSRQLRELEQLILQQDATLEPQPRPAARPQARLPGLATPFIGRARELAEIVELSRGGDSRLLTLTGAGGSGKTRLALRAAELIVSDYRNGAWFVGFADVADPELIAPTICQTLGVGEKADSTPLTRLKGELADLELLLVLDNLEQLVEGSGVLAELLSACPGLRLLVTSREPLRLRGERQYEVPVLARADAVELFSARAKAVAPRQGVTSELAIEICERLDCLPLAIELAAARLKALSPREMLARLDRRLPLLSGGPRDAPRRQQTLDATIEWSYELLKRHEQGLFARMAVFAGGCTLAAAEAVCGADLDTLHALVDRSLVGTDGERYQMLQTVREYALSRLEQTDQADVVRRAHAHWLVELLDIEGLATPRWPTGLSLTRLRPERENFRAALEWAWDVGAYETLAQLVSALTPMWVIEGQLREAQRWNTAALDHQDVYSGRLAAQVMSAARAVARHRGNTTEAAAFAKRALELWRDLGDPEALGRAMIDVGFIAVSDGQLGEGRRDLERAIEFARENALSDVLAAGLNNLADLAILEGRLQEARSLCAESLTVSAPGSSSADIGLINLAYVETSEGNVAEAVRIARQALDSARRRGDLLWSAWAAIGLARPVAAQGQLRQAGRLLGAALALLDRAGAGMDWMDEACERAVREMLRERLGEETERALLDEGRDISLEQAAAEVFDELAWQRSLRADSRDGV